MSADRSIVLGRLRASVLGRFEGIVTYLKTDRKDFGWCGSEMRFDACTILVDLGGSSKREQWYDDRHMWIESYGPNTISLFDRSYRWRSFFSEPVKWVLFHIPRSSLREYALHKGYTSIALPSVKDGFSHQDATLAHLAHALLPALARGEAAECAFVDHIFHAAIDHLVRTYCAVSCKNATESALLAKWQFRRVQDYVLSNLDQRITIADLAIICGLSSNHFGCTFKRTTGVSPHQWLLEQRIDRAKYLLLETKDTLSEIAGAVGFSDQSHFTAVFSKRVKASPAAWRRANTM